MNWRLSRAVLGHVAFERAVLVPPCCARLCCVGPCRAVPRHAALGHSGPSCAYGRAEINHKKPSPCPWCWKAHGCFGALRPPCFAWQRPGSFAAFPRACRQLGACGAAPLNSDGAAEAGGRSCDCEWLPWLLVDVASAQFAAECGPAVLLKRAGAADACGRSCEVRERRRVEGNGGGS